MKKQYILKVTVYMTRPGGAVSGGAVSGGAASGRAVSGDAESLGALMSSAT